MKILVANCLLVFCLVSSGLAFTQPQEQMEHMIKSAFEVLQKNELSSGEKETQLSELVQNTLHIKSMAKRTLGPSWTEATDQQRQQFTNLFVKVLEGTYLNQISSYSDAKVVFLQQRIKENKAIIDTKIVSAGADIPVSYKMFFEGDHWWVFDVVIEGVSLVQNYRSSYGEIIRRDGFTSLLNLMEKKFGERLSV